MCSQPDLIPPAQTLINSWIAWAEQQPASTVELVEWGKRDPWPLISLILGDRREQGPVVYISAGIHGDEPAGALALQEWIQENSRHLKGTWFLVPLLNPGGWDQRSRENPDSLDLNRDYGNPESIEITQHQQWLNTLPEVNMFLSLHEDYEAEGYYLYCLNTPKLGQHILKSVSRIMPLQETPEVDGNPLSEGMVVTGDPQSLLKEMPGWPEALWFYDRFPKAINITSETPSMLGLSLRVAAHKQVLQTLFLHLEEVEQKAQNS